MTVKSGLQQKKNIVVKYGIRASILSSIIKNKKDILAQASWSQENKRKRKAEFPDIEKCILKWFK